MTAKKRLLVDMDGTLAKFHDQNMYLERMYEKNFFLDLEPFQNMVDAIRDIIANHPEVEVYIVSAKVIGEPPYCVDEKNAWLDKYLPEIDQAHRIFTDMGHSKAEYIPGGVTKNDFLMDDYNKGLNLFLGDGGSAIKVMNNINMRGLGAYGGDKGYMWTGPLVTTEANPTVIVGDILECMGLERNKDKELQELGIQRVPASAWHKCKEEGMFLTEYPGGAVRVGTNLCDRLEYCASFGDAVKYLDAQSRGSIREQMAFDGFCISGSNSGDRTEGIIVSGWQLEAVCTNLGISKTETTRANADLMRRINEELNNSAKPVYGRMDYLDKDDNVIYSAYYCDPNEFLKEINRTQNHPQAVPSRAEWYIEPKQKDLLPEFRTPKPDPWILTDNDCLQYRRALDPTGRNDKFELCQIQELPEGYGILHGTVEGLAQMPKKELENHLRAYGYIDSEISSDYIVDYGLVAEMVFETDFLEYLDDPKNLTWNEAVDKIAQITGDPYCLEFKEPEQDSIKGNKTLNDMLKDAEARQGSGGCFAGRDPER